MDDTISFGQWLKQSRRALDLTQQDLAQQVGCSTETLRKVETERLRPSRQIAELLADKLNIPSSERALFIHLARRRPPSAHPLSQPSDPRDEQTPGMAGGCEQIPYLGLNTFQEQDAALFFGRETLIEVLLAKVDSSGFLAVIGPSGSGKSSLTLAGLVPALKRGALPGSADWHYVTLKPGSHPLDSLAVALAQLQGDDLQSALALSHAITESDRALLVAAELLDRGQKQQRLVVVIDQFEELWTQRPSDRVAQANVVIERQSFIQLLLSAAAAPNSPVRIIVTLRADFVSRAAEDAHLAHWIGEHDLIVSPMGSIELERAITCPAQAAGGDFEPGLVEELIAQVRDRPGALPLLEYTLLELWKARLPNGTMSWERFRALGGVEGALAARADALLESDYQPTQRDELRQVLIRLAQPDSEAGATRRRVLLDDLVSSSGSVEDVQRLLSPLINARLITMGCDLTTGEETVEVSHEALLRAWPTLSRWIDEDREHIRFQLELEAAAKEWQANHENVDFLWQGLRLELAQEWLAHTQVRLHRRDLLFLQTSREHEQNRLATRDAERHERERLLIERAAEQRNASRLRAFLLGTAALLLLALFFAGVAFLAERQSQQARASAEDSARSAQSFADAGEALFELDRRPEQALLLTLGSVPTDTKTYPPMIARALYRTFTDSAIRRILIGHDGDVRTAAWSPDGLRVLSGSDDGTVRVWDVTTGATIRVLRGHDGPIRAVAWSPDGQWILSGSADKTARVWNISADAPVRVLRGHTNWVSAVAWSPDGRQILTGSYDQTVRVWDSATSTEVLMLKGTVGLVRSVTWSPDGHQVLTVGDDGAARLWDASSGVMLRTLFEMKTLVASVAWSPDGRYVLTGGEDGTANIWVAATGELVRTFKGHTSWLWTVAWSPDGHYILTGSFDGTARVWDATTGVTAHILRGHTDKIWTVAWSPDGRRMLTASADRTIRVWEAARGTAVHALAGHTERINVVAWSSDRRYVLTGGFDGTAQVWNAATGKPVSVLPGHVQEISAVGWRPDGQQALTGSTDGMLRLWEVPAGRLIQTIAGGAAAVRSIAWSPNGRQVLIGSDDGAVGLWDVSGGRLVQALKGHTSQVLAVAWNPDGRQALTGSDDGTVRLWELPQGTAVQTLTLHAGFVRALAWSPDGRKALIGTEHGLVYLWDTTSSTTEITLKGHVGAILAVVWSPDGQQALTAGDDGTIRVWDMTTGSPVYMLEGSTSGANSAVWSPDQRQVLTTNSDQQTVYVHRWIVSSRLMIADITRRVCALFTDDQIRDTIPHWPGCEAALVAVSVDLTQYDALQGDVSTGHEEAQ